MPWTFLGFANLRLSAKIQAYQPRGENHTITLIVEHPMPKSIQAEVIYTPPTDELRFLTEGPYRVDSDKISWVAIQHGSDAQVGSLNLLNLASGDNRSTTLPGRPGFAFPTSKANHFVVGMERQVCLVDATSGEVTSVLADGVDQQVDNTMINDGMVCGDYLIFGCKDLEFATQKAGLYLLKPDRSLVQLADDQVCSNGKDVRRESDGTLRYFDICSWTKQIVSWSIDLEAGTIRDKRVVVDLTSGDVFPDGLILTPDQQSLIVAIFNPGDADFGEARQYNVASGELETVWICPASPRVTCPQLVERNGQIKLLLTTADEGMEWELREKSKHAGCLFLADTDFDQLNENPVYPVSS